MSSEITIKIKDPTVFNESPFIVPFLSDSEIELIDVVKVVSDEIINKKKSTDEKSSGDSEVEGGKIKLYQSAEEDHKKKCKDLDLPQLIRYKKVRLIENLQKNSEINDSITVNRRDGTIKIDSSRLIGAVEDDDRIGLRIKNAMSSVKEKIINAKYWDEVQLTIEKWLQIGSAVFVIIFLSLFLTMVFSVTANIPGIVLVAMLGVSMGLLNLSIFVKGYNIYYKHCNLIDLNEITMLNREGDFDHLVEGLNSTLGYSHNSQNSRKDDVDSRLNEKISIDRLIVLNDHFNECLKNANKEIVRLINKKLDTDIIRTILIAEESKFMINRINNMIKLKGSNIVKSLNKEYCFSVIKSILVACLLIAAFAVTFYFGFLMCVYIAGAAMLLFLILRTYEYFWGSKHQDYFNVMFNSIFTQQMI